VFLFFIRMFFKFSGDCLGVNPRGHVVMAFVPQDADNLGRQGLVQQLNYSFAVSTIPLGDGAILYVLTGPSTKFGDVGYEASLLTRWCHFIS
jgi:hypothetical protein